MIRRGLLEGGTFLVHTRFGYFSLAKERKVTRSHKLRLKKETKVCWLRTPSWDVNY